MNTLISLLLMVFISPTLIDRSDLGNNCDSVLSRRSISQEAINNGAVQGSVYVNEMSVVGIVDNASAKYGPCNEFGERFYRAKWLVSATLSANGGLSVIENGRIVFQQHRPYGAKTGVIRIQHQGIFLRYYLNGVLVFTSAHPDVASRDLRAYYFGTVENPLIGIPRAIKMPLLNWFDRRPKHV